MFGSDLGKCWESHGFEERSQPSQAISVALNGPWRLLVASKEEHPFPKKQGVVLATS